MTATRTALPALRPCTRQHAHVGGHSVFVEVGHYPDGGLGEVRVELHKEGATLRGFADALAGVLSVALQHGVPIEELVEPLVGIRCEPDGDVLGHATITRADSIPDYLGLALLGLRRAP